MSVNKGQRTFNFGLKTTKDNAEQVEKIISTHAAFMRENHSLDDILLASSPVILYWLYRFIRYGPSKMLKDK